MANSITSNIVDRHSRLEIAVGEASRVIRGNSNRRAFPFTLIEIMAVLAIFMLVSALAYTFVSKKPASLTLSTVATGLTNLMDTARRQASLQGATKRVLFDADSETFYLSGEQGDDEAPPLEPQANAASETFSLPANAGIKVEFKGGDPASPSYVFFPDGTAAGPKALLEIGGHVTTVSVSELTGMPLITAGDATEETK